MPSKAETANMPDSGMTTEQAMNRVLEAESNAQQHIAHATQEADALLEQARQRARRIQERTDNRIARIHQRCNRWLVDEVNRIQQSAPSESGFQQYELDDAVTDNVVERIASLLTTGQ